MCEKEYFWAQDEGMGKLYLRITSELKIGVTIYHHAQVNPGLPCLFLGVMFTVCSGLRST